MTNQRIAMIQQCQRKKRHDGATNNSTIELIVYNNAN